MAICCIIAGYMPTEITQTVSNDGTGVVFRITGDMLLEDALLLERFARNFVGNSSSTVTIDLADLHYIDSEAAAILKRLQDEAGVLIDGVEIFLQSAIDSAERSGNR
jgi:anti-anti-sigma regulatory factor